MSDRINLVLLRTIYNELELGMITSLLEDNNIPFILKDSGSGGYMKDNTGQTVISVLNENMCKDLASAGGGAYIHVDNNSTAQEQLNSELAKLSKKDMNSTIYSEYDEQFQAFGILAIVVLIIEICILDRKNPLLKNIKLFRRK